MSDDLKLIERVDAECAMRHPTLGSVVLSVPDARRLLAMAERGEAELNALAAEVLEICRLRHWSLHWTARGSYLHLESSELIEAIRGKRGVPQAEAADVLIVLMSITQNAGIPFSSVVNAAKATLEQLRMKPPYKGEERMDSALAPKEPPHA